MPPFLFRAALRTFFAADCQRVVGNVNIEVLCFDAGKLCADFYFLIGVRHVELRGENGAVPYGPAPSVERIIEDAIYLRAQKVKRIIASSELRPTPWNNIA